MPATFPEMVFEHADDAGQITWREASLIAVCHGVWSEFAAEYACLLGTGCGVDVGEFLVWLGY